MATDTPPPAEDVAAKLTAAWEVFARTCSAAVAPEATFQAWFAHHLGAGRPQGADSQMARP